MFEPSGAPPGWYPTPDGSQQYWDGQQWLAIPPPGTPDDARPSKRTRILVAFIGVLVLAAVVGGGLGLLYLDREADREAAAQAEASAVAAEAESAQAAEQASAEAAAREQESRDEQERELREAMVLEIEASVLTMAEEHIEEGLLDATEVLSVVCSPVAGVSVGDLDLETTVFECFVATEDNGDGTMTGFGYNATMNWTTGSYTYAFGDP